MTKLRLVAFGELSKVAEKAGFKRVRQEGSHNTFRNPQGRIIVIPDHGSQVIVRFRVGPRQLIGFQGDMTKK